MASCLLVLILTINFYIITHTNGALTTQTVNAAFRKTVAAKKTCGTPMEKYFKVTENDKVPRQRTLSYCDASNASLAQNASYLVDGNLATFWQSTAMVMRANITIDLNGSIHKFYFIKGIEIYFEEFFRPLQIAFYKSSDNGATYKPWQFYVTSDSSQVEPAEQCQEKFKMTLGNKPAFVNDVICEKYPNETMKKKDDIVTWNPAYLRGELTNPSKALVDWVNVTNIRIDFMELYRPYDPLAVRFYHYAVKEVFLDAYCPCNGHGVGCKYNNNTSVKDNQCVCQPGTCGDKCDTCCPAFNQFPWKHGGKGPMVVDEASACQPCNCHNHSSVCVYNQTVADKKQSLTVDGKYNGGGVCQNCQHNTTGINCEQCQTFFYRPTNRSRYAENVCEACGCSEIGCRDTTVENIKFLDCQRETNVFSNHIAGECFCKKNVMGRICDRCKPGFYNLTIHNPDGCQVCLCDEAGSVNRTNVCEPDEDGQCPCKPNVHGIRCQTCNDTYYGLTQNDPMGCKACMCNYGGSNSPVCNKQSGQCVCLENITGRQCERPKDQAYYPDLHFMSSSQESKENPWVTSINIMKGVNTTSGLFTLLMSYQINTPQAVTITVTSINTTTTKSVTLKICNTTCIRNISEFGEMSLSGMVTVNVTFSAGFHGKKVVALPKEFSEPTALRENMDMFLANCSAIDNDVKNGTSVEQFCKQSVFTVTTAYLGKALECNCNSNGSYNLVCEKYGGQCLCKPGVTGRQCDQCIPGYYNFTSSGCTACGCTTDNKVCDPVNGQCVCPPNTIGRVCDKCNETYWGWNQTTGCQACNCDTTGSSDLQCNLTTGICSCKDGVHLDKCSECQDGYKNFSSAGCSLCTCDMRGSLNPVCDKSSGQCPCKNNSMGMLCNQCKAGSFYLHQPNPKGCTDCVCMGITNNCSGTGRYVYQRSLVSSLWELYDEDNKTTIPVETSVMAMESVNVALITANVSSSLQKLIWQAKINLTARSLVSSYGGNLSFAVHVTNLSGAVAVAQPKVILKGEKGISIEQSFASIPMDQLTTRAVFMKEESWSYAGTNNTVSREHFLLVLAKPLAIHVTASLLSGGDGYYKTSFGDISISDVQDKATIQGKAVDVEHCNCGPEYTGLSCERCAPSHHRVNVTGDSYFGKCSRCNCYEHTLDCHADSGFCYNCDHNTTGNHCELCLDGFYGNATDGTPSDCKTCPCVAPKTTTSLCTDYYGQPKCTNCSEGYEGLQCDKCKIKYFGKPHLAGGNCSLCQCNNNSDVCDTMSGECQSCKYNTTGFHCERCKNETYGYALVQNCTACACNSTGSKNNVCNHRTGMCECQPNINSRDCSTCMFKSYNFTSTGCTECKCNVHGSSNLQCNESGLCECKTHALGDKCDRCETNFFGLPHASCKACDCNSTGSNTSVPCDGVTGQCHCKPGVTGRQCDRCMVMHHNFSSSGCTPCDNCSRITLQGKLNTTQKTITLSLEKGTQVRKLRPFKLKLTEVENRIKTTEGLVTEFNKRVQDLQDGLEILKSNTLNSSIHTLQNRLSSLTTEANRIKQNTTLALNKVQEIKNKTEDAMNLFKDVNGLTTSITNELNNLKNSAADMLSMTNTTLQSTYTDEATKTNTELARAKYVNESLVKYARGNVTHQRTTAASWNTSIVGERKSLNDKLDEFEKLSKRNDAITRLNQEVKVLVQSTLSLIAQSTIALAEARKLLDQGRSPLASAWLDISHGQKSLKDTESIITGNTGLSAKLTGLKTSVSQTQTLIRSTNMSVYINGTLHAANLTAEANLRKSELDSVQDNAKRAVDAIKQYESVVKLVNQSLETSVKVNQSLHETMKVLNDFSKSLNVMEKSAQETLKMSQELLNKTLTRNTDIVGLQSKVSTANQTILGTISIGTQIDQYYNILLSKSNKLIELSEPRAPQHSIITNTINAESWVEQVNQRWGSIVSNAAAVQQEVNRLNTSMATVNSNAEHARSLMPQGFLAVSRTNVALQNLTQNINQAAIEKNKTADLQTQLTSNMKRLHDKLVQAKARIAKIQHALRLQGKTSVQYTPTGRVTQKTAFSDVSFDIKADSVQGPLLYIAEKNSDLDNQVSLSLGLVYGEFVKFTYNLGSGPISIINYETPIRRGYWYRVYASRLKETARLSVTNYASNQTSTYESASNLILPYKVTNFAANSPMFIGSLPDGAMINETRRYFSGCIDNVVINQQSINLWQPAKVTGNRSVCSKCLDSASTPGFYDITSGTSFYGSPNTYVIQSMGGFDISQKSEMMFQFRTFQNVTSIMNVRGDSAYIYGMYISSGRVFFYFKNGAITHSLSTNKTSYNDGRWYEVHVTRGLTNSTLSVKDIGSGSVDISHLVLNSSITLAPGRKIVFGGRNPKSNFNAPINSQFAGALRNISLSTASGDMETRQLNNNTLLEGSNQVNFCGVLKVVEPCIRFIGNSYAAVNTGIKTVNVLSFKFKTLNPSGVLAYGFDASLNYYFYLALFHGNLYIVATNTTNNAQASYTTGETLNRGDYHSVHIAIANSRLRVNLDTRSTPVINIPASGPILINGTLYIGGLPASYNVSLDIPVVDSFVGGMRDLLVNNRAQNIFSGTADQVSLAGCTPQQTVLPTPKPTIPPPTQPPPTCGSRYPSLQLSTAANQVRLGPGLSYIGFNLTREVLNYMLFQHVITITFRSLSPNGVLFYAADNLKTPSSFIAIELVNGRLVFKFNYGGGLVRVQSKLNTYASSGDWYKAHFVRISQFGALLVSTINDYNNHKVNKTLPLILNSPVYYGGVPTGINTSMLEAKKPNGDSINFYGCLENLDITSSNRSQVMNLNPRKDFDPGYSSKGNASCYKAAQPQASFNGRSYIKLYENYKLTDRVDVTMSFRTYIRTGLLLVWTNKTGPGAVTMEQLQGQVVLTFTSESNKTILRWTDPDISAQQQYNASYKLCDNNIHTIRVQRQQSTVKITIDNHKEESFTIQDGFQLDGDLYIGGVPDGGGFPSHTGFSKRRFEGCVQRLIVNLKHVDLVRDPVSQEQIQPVCRGKTA